MRFGAAQKKKNSKGLLFFFLFEVKTCWRALGHSKHTLVMGTVRQDFYNVLKHIFMAALLRHVDWRQLLPLGCLTTFRNIWQRGGS